VIAWFVLGVLAIVLTGVARMDPRRPRENAADAERAACRERVPERVNSWISPPPVESLDILAVMNLRRSNRHALVAYLVMAAAAIAVVLLAAVR
jgi:hypothetical protein